MVMFNMEWFLPGVSWVPCERGRELAVQYLTDASPCPPGHTCDKCKGGDKHRTFLAFWLDSIAAHARDPNEEPEIAPIILVGTHKDRVPSPEDHER